MRFLSAIAGLLAALTLFAGSQLSVDVDEEPPTALAQHVPPKSSPPLQRAKLPAAASTPTIRLQENSLRIVSSARKRLKRRDRSFRDDCSGYVASALHHAGALGSIPLQATVAAFYADAVERDALHHHPFPVIGDLAFFNNTLDRDGDGRMNDKNTHIAIVIDIEPDGTIVLAHKGSDYRIIRMNLLHPSEAESPEGGVWNSWLRRTGDRGNPLGMYRTGELWSGFAASVSEEGGPEAPADRDPNPGRMNIGL